MQLNGGNFCFAASDVRDFYPNKASRRASVKLLPIPHYSILGDKYLPVIVQSYKARYIGSCQEPLGHPMPHQNLTLLNSASYHTTNIFNPCSNRYPPISKGFELNRHLSSEFYTILTANESLQFPGIYATIPGLSIVGYISRG